MYVQSRKKNNFGFSRRRNDKAEVRVYGAYGRNFAPRISVDRARKATHRFRIGGIYCSRYILISYREFGPDRVRKSGQAVSHIIERSSVDSRSRAELLFARERAEVEETHPQFFRYFAFIAVYFDLQ